MRIEQPIFPLPVDTFVNALRTGHGRVRQQIDVYGSKGLEEKIIEACISCLTYDPQCEAERAPWLFSITERAKLGTKVLQALAAAVHLPPLENHRDMDHRCALLKEFAASGSDEARRLLYLSLVRLSHTADVIGADHIVALDGVDGLIRVARQLGRWLNTDPDFYVDDWLIDHCDESAGIGRGLSALALEAEVDQDVARYLVGLRRTRESQSASTNRIDVTTYTGAEIVLHVSKKPKDQCHWFRLWGAKAASDQRETVFAALLVSNEPEDVKRLFRCFAKTGVPRFDSRLLQWLDHSDTHVRWAAVKAMAQTTHFNLRQIALRLIADGNLTNGIALLVNNFEGGDFALCSGHLKQLDDMDEVHHLVGVLLDLCEAHPGAGALDFLLYVYECSPCSTCRRTAVEAMLNSKTAPAWVLTESAFDADPDTRALVGPK